MPEANYCIKGVFISMEKLSKLYRDDSAVITSELRQQLDEVFLPTLHNLEVEHPQVVVVFSGGNAVGKSTLSKKIGNELQAVVLENDAIKRSILGIMPNVERITLQQMTWQYSMDLYRRLPDLTKNGLVVRDGLIDWYYDRILPIFENGGYRLFVIQYEVSKEASIQAIKRRGDTPTITVERLLMQLEDHEIHQRRFRSHYKADIIIDESNLFDHDRVVALLRESIESQPPTSVL